MQYFDIHNLRIFDAMNLNRLKHGIGTYCKEKDGLMDQSLDKRNA
jgi:hypothetical protein